MNAATRGLNRNEFSRNKRKKRSRSVYTQEKSVGLHFHMENANETLVFIKTEFSLANKYTIMCASASACVHGCCIYNEAMVRWWDGEIKCILSHWYKCSGVMQACHRCLHHDLNLYLFQRISEIITWEKCRIEKQRQQHSEAKWNVCMCAMVCAFVHSIWCTMCTNEINAKRTLV